MTSNQALQASTLVGRSVLVESSEGFLGDTGGLSGIVNLDNGSQNVEFHITDSSGQQIRSVSMGPQGAGETVFNWDGFSSDGTRMPAGKYTITAESKGLNETVNLETFISADVESVTLNRNTRGISLNLRDMGSVDFSEVREIM
jgi:flagellar basal-body rod modification protein FlgD